MLLVWTTLIILILLYGRRFKIFVWCFTSKKMTSCGSSLKNKMSCISNFEPIWSKIFKLRDNNFPTFSRRVLNICASSKFSEYPWAANNRWRATLCSHRAFILLSSISLISPLSVAFATNLRAEKSVYGTRRKCYFMKKFFLDQTFSRYSSRDSNEVF